MSVGRVVRSKYNLPNFYRVHTQWNSFTAFLQRLKCIGAIVQAVEKMKNVRARLSMTSIWKAKTATLHKSRTILTRGCDKSQD